MKLFSKACVSAFIAFAVTAPAVDSQTAEQQKEITAAVLGIYDDEINRDPQNYNAFFRRAHVFYGLNQYSRALSDIDNAIRFTPEDDTDLRSQEFSLRANIYLMLKKPEQALPDLTKAYELDPGSFAYLYQKANTEFELGDYQAAKEDYRKLQRLFNRNFESLIGLARIAVEEKNLGLANEYIDQAVALYPTDSDVFLRRASVRRMIGNNTGAVDDMLVALSLEKNSSKAVSAIVNMSNTDFNAVISGLSNAITQAPDNGMFYYIRAMIAQAHYRYIMAIDDYNYIIDNNLYDYHGIHASLAQCYYALCDFQKANEEINYAIGSTANNGDYYITASQIDLAMGQKDVALSYADEAVTKLQGANKALYQQGLAYIAIDKFSDASSTFGEAIINDPENPVNYLIRAWILSRKLNRESDAVNFLTRCADLTFDETTVTSYRGFALNLLGQNEQAKEWMDGIITANPSDIDGRIHYLAACLYSQTGDIDKAFDCMSDALDKGYANLYDWKLNDVANINVSPLRKDARFEKMLNSYSYLFSK